MRTKIFITTLLLLFTLSINAFEKNDNNYDDIGNFFSSAEKVESPNIEHFYISKAMLTLTKGQVNIGRIKEGVDIEKFYDKIDFIRSVGVTANTTQQERDLLKGAEELAQRVYKQYDYKCLVTYGENNTRVHLFYKYGEGGLCSVLVVVTRKEEDSVTKKMELQFARALLMGGTFRAEDIPRLIQTDI